MTESWRFLHKTLARPRVAFVCMRYLAAVLVAGEALAFARILGPQNYGYYALIAQTAGLLLLAGAGTNSGYVYAFYKRPEPSLDAYYMAGAGVQFLLGGLVVTSILALFAPYLALSGVLFLICIPYFITEPMLRVRHHFTVSVLGKGLGSLMTLAITAIVLGRTTFDHPWLGLRQAVTVMLLGNLAGYGIYYGTLLVRKYLTLNVSAIFHAATDTACWKKYWDLILRSGLPDNSSGLLFLVFSYLDRMFIEHYRPPVVLSVYSLALQFLQGALLMLTSMNLVSGVYIGRDIATDTRHLRSKLRRHLRITTLVGLLAFAILVGGAAFLRQTVFRDYHDLVIVTVLLGGGYFVTNIVGSITSILTYERKYSGRIYAMLAVILASVTGNVVAVNRNWWYGIPVLISSLALVAMNVYLLAYTWSVAGKLSSPEAVTEMS